MTALHSTLSAIAIVNASISVVTNEWPNFQTATTNALANQSLFYGVKMIGNARIFVSVDWHVDKVMVANTFVHRISVCPVTISLFGRL